MILLIHFEANSRSEFAWGSVIFKNWILFNFFISWKFHEFLWNKFMKFFMKKIPMGNWIHEFHEKFSWFFMNNFSISGEISPGFRGSLVFNLLKWLKSYSRKGYFKVKFPFGKFDLKSRQGSNELIIHCWLLKSTASQSTCSVWYLKWGQKLWRVFIFPFGSDARRFFQEPPCVAATSIAHKTEGMGWLLKSWYMKLLRPKLYK